MNVDNPNANSALGITALVEIVNKNFTKSVTQSVIPNSQSQTITFTYVPVASEIPVFT